MAIIKRTTKTAPDAMIEYIHTSADISSKEHTTASNFSMLPACEIIVYLYNRNFYIAYIVQVMSNASELFRHACFEILVK